MTALSEKVVLRGLRFGEPHLLAAGFNPTFDVSRRRVADVWGNRRKDFGAMAGAHHLPTLGCHAGTP